MRKRRLLAGLIGLALAISNPASAAANRPRGLFVSAIQQPPVLSSREAIRDLVIFARRTGVTMLFVQVYYAGRTWFLSMAGDSGPYETALANVGEDPLNLLLEIAHESGIEVHAWLNMLSMNKNPDAYLLKKYGPQVLTRDTTAKQSIESYRIDNQYFLEPGDPRVRRELLALVRELLSAHPRLDGVQFDYIRYPDTHPVYGYNDQNVSRFKQATGARKIVDEDPAWQDWKRKQVTDCVQMLVNEARTLRPGIKVSATGCMPYARAYHEAFQDWPAWVNNGLVDFVTVMNYSPDPVQFARWTKDIKTKVRDFSRVNTAIGAYKLIGSPEIFETEYGLCESSGGGACVVFHYANLLEDPDLQRPLLLPGLGDPR